MSKLPLVNQDLAWMLYSQVVPYSKSLPAGITNATFLSLVESVGIKIYAKEKSIRGITVNLNEIYLGYVSKGNQAKEFFHRIRNAFCHLSITKNSGNLIFHSFTIPNGLKLNQKVMIGYVEESKLIELLTLIKNKKR